MTDQSQSHPTLGRRRRHKNPANASSMHDLPLPRSLDHMAAEDRPSEAEEEKKEAKRQRSASITPRSTSGTLPHDYDMVMGITAVEPLVSEKFEGGTASDFQDAEETETHSQETTNEIATTDNIGVFEIHGGHGSASLRKCVQLAMQQPVIPATCRSGEGLGDSANPSHFFVLCFLFQKKQRVHRPSRQGHLAPPHSFFWAFPPPPKKRGVHSPACQSANW